ncbi:thermitase [Tumebacillus sp. BK434]|uniref:S8 family serine peptidase n=1 Tax=Tumebacillus sp. BK434 TaxID=2512169 RepID=UPI001053D4DB|nr:S8 family serine peptidase [Tumebacillus sp. BK434]TCP58231.1 thermitase [Tumebacillus sp. BK434]
MLKNKMTQTLLALAVLSSAAVFTTAPVQAEEEEKVIYADDRLIVQIEDGINPKEVAAEYGIETVQPLGEGVENWHIFYVKPGEVDYWLDKLRDAKYIKLIERDIKIFPKLLYPDPEYKYQWHQEFIGADKLWKYDHTYRTIAFIDSGVDYSHADLRSRIIPGYDFVNRDTIADDELGSGTHVAGIAAAAHNFTGGKGVDASAYIMPLKVLDKDGSTYTSTITEAIYWAANHGAHVISITPGTTTGRTSSMESAVNYAWQKGSFLVANAGNNSSSTPRYPAAYANVFSVAATDPDDKIWYRSNRGLWVDLAAPGTYIYSTRLGGGMEHKTGTEQAAAVTAGAASLLWQGNMSNLQVRNKLIELAIPIPYTGTYWEYGRLNLI